MAMHTSAVEMAVSANPVGVDTGIRLYILNLGIVISMLFLTFVEFLF